MDQYYFIGTSLPSLAIGKAGGISFHEFRDLLRMNLNSADLEKVNDLLWPVDLTNIRAQWLNGPFDDKGNLDSGQLEEALLVKEGFPPFINEFLDRYDSIEERLRFFPSLFTLLSLAMQKKYPSGFLHEYYRLEREIRLVLTALRAKRFGRSLLHELQFEDPTDSLVAEILAQKDAPDYTPPSEYAVLKALFTRCVDDPKELHKALLEYRFEKIEELEEKGSPFSIDAILGFTARLMLVESWNALDEPKGKELVEHLSQE